MQRKQDTSITWHTLFVECPSEAEELISTVLFELGSVGIVHESDSANLQSFKSYFHADKSKAQLIELIEEAFQNYKINQNYIQNIETIGFNPKEQTWKQNFPKFEIVPHIMIHPSWEQHQPQDG